MTAAIDLRNCTCLPEPAFMRRIRLRALRRVLWLRALWAHNAGEPVQDIAISHGEVDRILLDPRQLVEAEETFYQTDPTARELRQQIEAVEKLASLDAQWTYVCRLFDLSDSESDLLSLAVAAELDPALRRLYGYLNDDATLCYPTVWLASG